MTAYSRTKFALLAPLGLATGEAAAAAEVLNATRISQTLGVLAAIVAGIFALAYLLRRVPGISSRASGTLKLVDALSIGTRERILLVEVDGERLVLAVAAGRIKRLHVVPRAAAPMAGSFVSALATADVTPVGPV
jgi:flagellar protein FliO/FliZ